MNAETVIDTTIKPQLIEAFGRQLANELLTEATLAYVSTDGSEEEITSGDLFYWPPGHTLKVTEDTEIIMFSPKKEHSEVINHICQKLGL